MERPHFTYEKMSFRHWIMRRSLFILFVTGIWISFKNDKCFMTYDIFYVGNRSVRMHIISRLEDFFDTVRSSVFCIDTLNQSGEHNSTIGLLLFFFMHIYFHQQNIFYCQKFNPEVVCVTNL
jgi:hypothetical protein